MRRLLITTILAVAAFAVGTSPAVAQEAITITSGPGTGERLPISSATGTWTFDTSQATGPFECALDVTGNDVNWQPCTSPVTLPVTAGASFRVRTVSTSASASVWFGVDRTEPRATLGWPGLPAFLTGGGPTQFYGRVPSIPVSNNKGMTMWPDGTPREYVFYDCSVDSGPWSACTPVNGALEVAGLPDGIHTLAVKARDLAGNVQGEPSTHQFEYVTKPATPFPIVELPRRTTARKIRFQVLFQAKVPGLARCELDGQRLTGPCNAELEVEPGEHVYRVWAVSDAGVAGDAFEWRWTVVDAPVVSDFRHVAPVKPASLRTKLARCAKLAARKRGACREKLDDERYGALRFQLDEKARVGYEVKRNGKRTVAKSTVRGTRGTNAVALEQRLSPGSYTVTATAGKAEAITETFVVR